MPRGRAAEDSNEALRFLRAEDRSQSRPGSTSCGAYTQPCHNTRQMVRAGTTMPRRSLCAGFTFLFHSVIAVLPVASLAGKSFLDPGTARKR